MRRSASSSVEDAAQAGRHELAHAVPDHDRRDGSPSSSRGVASAYSSANVAGCAMPACSSACLAASAPVGSGNMTVRRSVPMMGSRIGRTSVERLAEGRLAPVEPAGPSPAAAHPVPGTGRRRPHPRRRPPGPRTAAASGCRRRRRPPAHRSRPRARASVRHPRAAHLQRVGHVRQVDVGVLVQVVGQPGCQPLERARRSWRSGRGPGVRAPEAVASRPDGRALPRARRGRSCRPGRTRSRPPDAAGRSAATDAARC